MDLLYIKGIIFRSRTKVSISILTVILLTPLHIKVYIVLYIRISHNTCVIYKILFYKFKTIDSI